MIGQWQKGRQVTTQDAPLPRQPFAPRRFALLIMAAAATAANSCVVQGTGLRLRSAKKTRHRPSVDVSVSPRFPLVPPAHYDNKGQHRLFHPIKPSAAIDVARCRRTGFGSEPRLIQFGVLRGDDWRPGASDRTNTRGPHGAISAPSSSRCPFALCGSSSSSGVHLRRSRFSTLHRLSFHRIAARNHIKEGFPHPRSCPS